MPVSNIVGFLFGDDWFVGIVLPAPPLGISILRSGMAKATPCPAAFSQAPMVDMNSGCCRAAASINAHGRTHEMVWRGQTVPMPDAGSLSFRASRRQSLFSAITLAGKPYPGAVACPAATKAFLRQLE